MSLEVVTPLEGSSSTSTSPTSSPPPAPKRQPSFWERTKQSTVSVWTSPRSPNLLESFYPTSLELESLKAAKILRTFTWDAVDTLPEDLEKRNRRDSQIVLKKIPPEVVQSAKGLVIFTVFRTGSLFSAINGSGIVVARLPDGSWSSPSAVLLKSISFGFSAGVDVYDIVLLLRNESAIEAFFQPQTNLGSAVAIAAGPVGSGMLLDDDAELASIWSYVKSKNLHYEGLKLDGTVLTERTDENARAYAKSISAEEILNGAVRPEDWCQGLLETISAAQGFDFRPELVPQGPSASESFPSASPATTASPSPSPALASPPLSPQPPPLSPNPSMMSTLSRSSNRRLPKEELSEEDLKAKKELEEMMKSFGIQDHEVYERSRSEDPLLVVEPQVEPTEPSRIEGGGDDSFEFGVGGTTTPELMGSTGRSSPSSASEPTSRRYSSVKLEPLAQGTKEEGESKEEAETTPKPSTESFSETNSTPAKPPVPPRRTPRIPAPASPVVGSEPETETKKSEPESEENKGLGVDLHGSEEDQAVEGEKANEEKQDEVVEGEESKKEE